jgi:hypothetical protein
MILPDLAQAARQSFESAANDRGTGQEGSTSAH